VNFRASALRHDISASRPSTSSPRPLSTTDPSPGTSPAWLVLGGDPVGVPLEVIVGEDRGESRPEQMPQSFFDLALARVRVFPNYTLSWRS